MWRRFRPRLIPKKLLKPLRRQGRAARCVLNIAIPEVRLDRAQVVAIVGELVATGMAQHVGADVDAQIGRGDRPPDRAGEPNAESGAPRSTDHQSVDQAIARVPQKLPRHKHPTVAGCEHRCQCVQGANHDNP
jgi:hypothetical protein